MAIVNLVIICLESVEAYPLTELSLLIGNVVATFPRATTDGNGDDDCCIGYEAEL